MVVADKSCLFLSHSRLRARRRIVRTGATVTPACGGAQQLPDEEICCSAAEDVASGCLVPAATKCSRRVVVHPTTSAASLTAPIRAYFRGVCLVEPFRCSMSCIGTGLPHWPNAAHTDRLPFLFRKHFPSRPPFRDDGPTLFENCRVPTTHSAFDFPPS
ncbi:hypothetical protein HMN09_00786100 [Mycena chlorophos]|uniref:Uncharacterized protein n=1 Tax=Mycena chlorophos TaxID=658473 RepID=A0A8H6W577_MYCCL|nr:hypothetical protein HMN09_00786100 [Mycena chlorophos]